MGKWYVGYLENGNREVKKVESPIEQPWLAATGPFNTKNAAIMFVIKASRATERSVKWE